MTTTTPNMSLVLPDVSVTAGPQYATLINAAQSLIDAHDHSTGKGVAITPSGMNISADLTFAQHNATNLRSARLYNNGSISLGVNDKTCVYALNNELYYVDGNGNNVQITSGGSVNIGSTSALTLNDTAFILQYFGDSTRKARFDVSNVPGSTTRIYKLPTVSANDTLASLTATQTLTATTLTGGTITGCTAVNLISGAGTLTLPTSGTITIPGATDTVALLAASQTITGKILTGNTIATFTPNGGTNTITVPAITDTLVTKTSTDDLTNKSFNGTTVVKAANELRFNNTGNTQYIGLKAGTLAGNTTFTLPVADGSSGQVMKTDGSATLGWATAATYSRGDVATSATIAALSSANSFIRLTGSTATSLQGITAGGAGAILLVYNVSTALVSITHANASASAANRILTPSTLTVDLQPQGTALFTYDDSQSRWILNHVTNSYEWTSYTPTISAGFGTATSVSAYYSVRGDTLHVNGSFGIGTPAASIMSITLPTGYTLTTSKLSLNNNTSANGNIVGMIVGNVAANQAYVITAPATATDRVYIGLYITSGANGLTVPQNGSSDFTSGQTMSFRFEVPFV